MKAAVDRLSAQLTDRYVQYLEAFTVDLWSDYRVSVRLRPPNGSPA